MISRYIVTLNGISLESIHPAILITDVQYPPVAYERESISIVNRDGARIHRSYKEKSEVTISFMIREYDVYNRQLICQDICKWAMDGGRLMTNDRPLQFLDCIVDSFPAVESTKGWTEELTITFAAYGIPYWQDLIQTELKPTAGSTSVLISGKVPGNSPWALVDVDITPSDTLTRIEIVISSTKHNLSQQKFVLSGMSVPANQTVTISHDENGVVRIYRNSYNLLRFQEGKDDLIAKCGILNNFNYAANCACTVVYKVRGYYE